MPPIQRPAAPDQTAPIRPAPRVGGHAMANRSGTLARPRRRGGRAARAVGTCTDADPKPGPRDGPARFTRCEGHPLPPEEDIR